MDLKLLKAFVGVAEHGTVSKAAEVLHVTQPALSRQIRSLEHQAGFDLFERAGRGLVLTPRGAQLLTECRGLLTHADALSERTRRLRRGDLQVLRVAAASLTIEALFPAFLGRYARHVPDVHLTLLDAHAADHLGMLERGDADLSVAVINMLPLDDRHFASRLLPRFQMLAACSPSFPIEAGDVKDIGALDRHPLLVLDPSYATRNVFDAACHLAGFKPTILFEGRSVNTLLAMAEAGHGIAIVPSVLKIDPARIRTMLVTHRREPLQLAVAVIWDKRRMPSRHADQFADLLAAYVRETYPPAPGPTPLVSKRPVRAADGRTRRAGVASSPRNRNNARGMKR
jgi:DNA-binding transcriptional LysR family regulator